jgi:ankyrin repeat protein
MSYNNYIQNIQYGSGGCKRDDWIQISSRVDNKGTPFGQVVDSNESTCTIKLGKRKNTFEKKNIKMLLDSNLQHEYNYPKFLADVEKFINSKVSQVIPIPERRPANTVFGKVPIKQEDYIEFKKKIERKDIDGVRLLIERGINVNIRFDNLSGINCLILAIQKGFIDIVKLLINAKSDVNYETINGSTPLMFASALNQIEIVKLLIARGADINKTDHNNKSSVTYAFGNKHFAIIDILRKAGAEINLDILYHLIINSCINNLIDTLRDLIKNPEIEINKFHENKMTFLMYACYYERIEIVNLLIAREADVNKTSEIGSPLQLAIDKKNIDLVRILIEKGANVNFVNNEGKSLLKRAIELNLPDIIEILIVHGSTFDATIKKSVILNGNIKIFLYLISKNLIVDDEDYNKILINACKNSNLEGFNEYINNQNLNLNYQDENKKTCLMYLLKKCDDNNEKILLLINKNVNVNLFDNNGDTALHYALQICLKNQKIIEKLCNIDDIDVLKKNNSGISAFDYLDKRYLTILPLLKQSFIEEKYDVVFLDSCKYSNFTYFDILIKKEPQINFDLQDENGQNSLMHLIKNIEIDKIKLLLTKNIKINAVDNNGDTALHHAINQFGTKIVKELLKYKNIDINIYNKEGKTVLFNESFQILILPLYIAKFAEDINGLILNLCKNNYFMDLHVLLSKENIFIDMYDEKGYSLLMLAIIFKQYDKIPILLQKGININAVDINGDTALHHALRLNDTRIIEILTDYKEIIPFIPNNLGITAVDVSKGTRYYEKIKDIVGIKLEELQNQPWKGVTLDYIKNLDITLNGPEVIIKNDTYCPNCLESLPRREGGCNHITHNCMVIQNNKYKLALEGAGGFPPYYYQLDQTNITHLCVVCAELNYRYNEINGHTQDSMICNKGSDYKYYRLYKIIQKFIELQPKPDTELKLTFKEAMKQIIEAGNNAVYNPTIFNPIVAQIKSNQTCLPKDHPFTNDKSFKQLYPPIGGVKKIPNMRKTRDVIENDLMPKIISYTRNPETDKYEKINPETGKITEASTCALTYDFHDSYIAFRHREFTIDQNYKITEHENVSIEGFLDTFKRNISIIDDNNFGKCVLEITKICKSYLYPDELKILVINGKISHDQYVTYRKNFSISNKINIEFSPQSQNYFLPAPVPITVPVPAPALAQAQAQANIPAGGVGEFKKKYLKYKMKYLNLKNSINSV